MVWQRHPACPRWAVQAPHPSSGIQTTPPLCWSLAEKFAINDLLKQEWLLASILKHSPNTKQLNPKQISILHLLFHHLTVVYKCCFIIIFIECFQLLVSQKNNVCVCVCVCVCAYVHMRACMPACMWGLIYCLDLIFHKCCLEFICCGQLSVLILVFCCLRNLVLL